MIVSDSHKFIYARVPKTASTSVSAALSKYRRLSERVRYIGIVNKILCCLTGKKNIKFSSHPHLSFNAAKQIIGPQKFNSYFRFSVVRHPVDRLYSHFRHVKRNLSCPKFRAVYPEMLKQKSNFEYFLECIESKPVPPQIAMFIDDQGSIQANAVARIECLDKELFPIFSRLGLKYNIERLNVGDTGHNASCEVTHRARNLIEKLYQVDYECFGYDRFTFKKSYQFPKGKIQNIKALILGESIWQRNQDAA